MNTLISIVIAVPITFLSLRFYRLELIECAYTFVGYFLVVFGLLFIVSIIEEQLHSGKPFKDLFILSTVSFALSLVALLESLQNISALYSFLPLAILFLSLMIRTHYLASTYQKAGLKREPKLRELPYMDKVLIALWICGFFIFLVLTGYYLGWIPT